MRKRAFTITELIIVTGIVALLAMALYPVWRQAKANGQSVTCKTNLRQIGLALLQYAGDYDEVLPASVYYQGADDTTPVSHYWRDVVRPYTHSDFIWNCPGDLSIVRQSFAKYAWTGIPRTNTNSQGSYWCNGAYPNDRARYGDVAGPCRPSYYLGVALVQHMAAVTNPSRTVWAADATGSRRRPNFHFRIGQFLSPDVTTDPNYPGYDYLLSHATANNGLIAWHNDGANVLYVDGHVVWQTPARLCSQRAARDPRVLSDWTIQDD